MGNKITYHSPSRGCSMEMGAAITVLVFSQYSLPVSTSMCITGATVGVGLCNGTYKAVNWYRPASYCLDHDHPHCWHSRRRAYGSLPQRTSLQLDGAFYPRELRTISGMRCSKSVFWEHVCICILVGRMVVFWVLVFPYHLLEMSCLLYTPDRSLKLHK
jgi:phosphate/sulfate permease